MIDIAFIREQPDVVKAAVTHKNLQVDIDRLLELDVRRRELIGKIEELRSKRNELADQAKGAKPTEEQIAAGKELKDKIAALEAELAPIDTEFEAIAGDVPNIIADDTPMGGEEANRVESTWGESTKREFELKDHVALATAKGWLDFDRGTKVAGNKFYFLMGNLVLLERALTSFVIDEVAKAGFVPTTVPHMVNTRVAEGTGYAPRGEERQTYKIEGEDLNLIATAEVPLTGMHADEVLDLSRGAKQYAGISPSYRMEAGAYGRYNKGLYRVHQFNKIEVYVYCDPSDSEEWHQKLLRLEQHICEQLGLPYQVVRIAAGDLGAPAYKKYDIEYWSPVEGEYRELMSCANVTDYQARRLNIKMRTDGGTQYVHTLNATALALSRGLIAVLENYQQADGSVRIPDVLQHYMGGRTSI